MAILNKSQITGAKDAVVKEVEVPEWDGSVLLKSLSARARDRFGQRVSVDEDGTLLSNIHAEFLALVICDEEDKRVFSSPQDIKELGTKNAGVIKRLYDIAKDMNGMDDKALETASKNLEATPSEDTDSA